MKERILQFIGYLGITNKEFERTCDMSNGYINSMHKGLGLQKVEQVLSVYPQLNRNWLLTGMGEMLNSTEPSGPTLEDCDQFVAEPKNVADADVVRIPIINLDARGGFLSNQETDVSQYVTDYVLLDNSMAQGGDVVINMYGDSMYPRYPSGSKLLIRQVETWREYLELGACYVIELTDGRRVVKIVRKGSDKEHFNLLSVNPEFDEQEIPISLINRVFLVKLMIKSETV